MEDAIDYLIDSCGFGAPVALGNFNYSGETGIFYGINPTNRPPNSLNWMLLHLRKDANSAEQIAISLGDTYPLIYARSQIAGTWDSFTAASPIWSRGTDANGGQGPAPKPQISTASLPGFEFTRQMALNEGYGLPAGGSFMVEELTSGTTIDTSSPSYTGIMSAIVNGGATVTQKTAAGVIRCYRLT
jgi:hypothetical protein